MLVSHVTFTASYKCLETWTFHYLTKEKGLSNITTLAYFLINLLLMNIEYTYVSIEYCFDYNC